MRNGASQRSDFQRAYYRTNYLTLVSQNGQTLTFQLAGQLYNGTTVSGTTTQLFRTTPAQLAKGIVHLTSRHHSLGGSGLKPGTLGLLGWLGGIARTARRKLLVR